MPFCLSYIFIVAINNMIKTNYKIKYSIGLIVLMIELPCWSTNSKQRKGMLESCKSSDTPSQPGHISSSFPNNSTGWNQILKQMNASIILTGTHQILLVFSASCLRVKMSAITLTPASMLVSCCHILPPWLTLILLETRAKLSFMT